MYYSFKKRKTFSGAEDIHVYICCENREDLVEYAHRCGLDKHVTEEEIMEDICRIEEYNKYPVYLIKTMWAPRNLRDNHVNVESVEDFKRVEMKPAYIEVD